MTSELCWSFTCSQLSSPTLIKWRGTNGVLDPSGVQLLCLKHSSPQRFTNDQVVFLLSAMLSSLCPFPVLPIPSSPRFVARNGRQTSSHSVGISYLPFWIRNFLSNLVTLLIYLLSASLICSLKYRCIADSSPLHMYVVESRNSEASKSRANSGLMLLYTREHTSQPSAIRIFKDLST